MAETDPVQTPLRPPKQFPLATWLALKADYVHGKGAIADLCRKYGLSRDRAYKRSGRENWSDLRDKYMEAQNRKLETAEQDGQAPAPKPPSDGQVQTRADKVLSQIDQLDRAISVCSAVDYPKLADAKAKLWGLIFPKPGTIRKNRKPINQTIEPIEPVPVPDPVPNPTLP